MALTYLQIVNRALAEAKVTVDPLTADDFLAPPRTLLYNRFKDWVNYSIQELNEARPEWFFRKERTTLSIWPRLYFKDVLRPLIVGETLIGSVSGTEIEVVAIHQHESIENNLGDEVTISVLFLSDSSPNDLVVDEVFSGVATYVGPGRYNFQEDLMGLRHINPRDIRVFDTPAQVAAGTGTTNRQGYPIRMVNFSEWPYDYSLYPWTGDYPTYISQTPQGDYALYPMPKVEKILGLEYTRSSGQLVLPTDIPVDLPEEFHMFLVWRTVMEFADFDNNAMLFSRARKHVDDYRNWMERDELPQITMDTNRFYDYNG